MKTTKRILAFALFLSLFISLLPPVQIARAAEVVQRYELDTDGIDAGATYLIVNSGSAGSRYVMRRNGSNTARQSVTVRSADGVVYIDPGFDNESNAQFTFTGSSSGMVTNGNYNLALSSSSASFTTGTSNTSLTFSNQGNGAYRIYRDRNGSDYYLYYGGLFSSSWKATTSANSVYLYKLVEYNLGYDVTFNGNGHTSGTLPANMEGVEPDTQITLPAPTDLRQDDDDENTWLFLCWNTKADGSGTEHRPGEVLTVTENITLYAQWYLQTKYTVSMITYMDGVATDVSQIAGYDRSFYAVLEGGDGTYIPLTRRSEGTYSAKVVEEGTYTIYAITADGKYEPVHGHTVVIYGQDGTTECMHYSVTYDTNGGTWAEGEAPAAEKYHFGEAATAWDKTPALKGNRFLGWKDRNGNLYAPGQQITASVDAPIKLTAQWEDLIDITVNVVIDHNAASGGEDWDKDTMHNAMLTALRVENGVNLPVEEMTLTTGYTYDSEKNITTYQVVFRDMPQGVYHAAGTKSNYETTVSYEGEANQDQTITVNFKYVPENFDLNFDVVVNGENDTEKALMPKAVNVKVSYWGYDDRGVLGWHIITQQAGSNVPTTVTIGDDGKGSGYFPVWRYWSGNEQPYMYRLEVTSFILPDGTIVPATTGDQVTYTIDGSGLYRAAVSIVNGGQKPTYPDGSNTELAGAYFSGQKQEGVPTVTVDITPYTVTFDAGEGTVNGQKTIVMNGQLRYPALYEYVAVPNANDRQFICWLVNGEPATDMAGQLLSGNVTYTARYNENITLSGLVSADASYQQDGQTVYIHDIDRAEKVMVVLQKKVGDVYNDVSSATVELTYEKNAEGKYTVGVGSYEFTDLPNDGTEYRVFLLVRNYTGAYDNDQDDNYTEDEGVVLVDELNAEAQVDIHLDFQPDDYQQTIRVDASQIHEDLRPTGVLAQILYRDLGDVHNYQVISQHTVDPYGVKVELNLPNAIGLGFYDVWNWHTNGAPYEYQAQIDKVYGKNVPGAYSEEGLEYTEDRPFTVVYGPANNYLQDMMTSGLMLEATLVPKQYPVYLDLNLGEDTTTPVVGLENLMVDDDTGNERYAFAHTWSFAESFTAYPYREGYVFKGWTSPNTDDVYIKDGVIYVGNTLAREITLTAQWEKLTGTDYTILYLELNTDQVLKGATIVEGSVLGGKVVAAEWAAAIEGYVYAGAMIGDVYYDKTQNPAMTVSNDPTKNLLVIYYLPDGSDGYTEQVESNLEINKTAVLEDNGTYTITMDTWTKDNPITTKIWQDTPLDVVLVLDQSGSMYSSGALPDLQEAAANFVDLLADHGRTYEVDHRVAVVGFASDATSGYTSSYYPTAGKDGSIGWVNTGVYDSNGDFHVYPITGFNYTAYTGQITANGGPYYTYVNGEYLLLTYHETYRHLITEDEARQADWNGTQVYGYVNGQFVELTRNSSGLWLYGDKLLYSEKQFFTLHNDVWTHRQGTERREIHAYGIGAAYTPTDGHEGVYTRTATKDANPEQSIYTDTLVPVSLGANGSGNTNPGLLKATEKLGANGETFVSYGMKMANSVFEANPLDPEEGRVRIVVVFTDGRPGDSSNFDEHESNSALEQSYIAGHTYGADVYTIGLYGDTVVAPESDQDFFMTGLSSNYPDAQCMDDVWVDVTYNPATSGYKLNNGGPYFVEINGQYYELTTKSTYESKVYYTNWGYTDASGDYVAIYKGPVADGHPVITNGQISGYDIYRRYGVDYKPAASNAYYTVADNAQNLKLFFANVVEEITTNITTEIILHEDTILRDIMNQGLVLTDGTVITAYLQEGNYDLNTGKVVWAVDANGNPILDKKVSLTIGSGQTRAKDPVSGVEIIVYNLDAENVTDPTKDNYSPHMVDITGYDFNNWFISEEKTKGYKLVATITRVEAMDNVQWSRSTNTNHERSGLWLPADEKGNRELLLPFDQPSTIFVERAYVLDYGKEFTLSGWYFDDEVTEDGTVVKNADPVHVDCDITNGMNWFDPSSPNTANAANGTYGNTKYGNVQVKDGTVTYTPTSMNWGGYDQFYVFGDTWRRTVLAQDANQNGNLWNKVTVIPANNIYYEDSFITTEDTTQNGIDGFVFTGAWTVEGQDSGNVESPEHQESAPYGDVHGWTDSLGDDVTFTDGSAHFTNTPGASAQFTFTGTGVEVYTRTNASSGMVVAVLSQIGTSEDGKETVTAYKSLAMDNLAASGDYYHIPTVAFKELPYGTYRLQLIATVATTATGTARYEYYIDGVRIHNPLGNTTNYQSDIVKDAYGLENNAIFTEVRDVLLDYGDFNADMSDGNDGKLGAVFIDWIQNGQGSGNDSVGTGVPSYEIGTFKAYGPKNEVYLSAGQAIVLKVAEGNTYYVGLKSLTGGEVTANVSGIDQAEPTAIKLSHTTDLYYQVTPVNGYIVIQNGNTDGALLSITNLRTTNLTEVAKNGGILPVTEQEAVQTVAGFADYMANKPAEEVLPPKPEEQLPSAEEQAQANQQQAAVLFTAVRQWLDEN